MKTLAVLGATGAVGQVMVELLQGRQLPMERIQFLASHRSAGRTIQFGDQTHPVQPIETADFHGIDLILSSMPADASRVHHPRAADAGAVVIDNSSAFRMDPEVPLVVPEVNPSHLDQIPKGIVANPNCSTIQMVVALKPLADAVGLRRVIVSTYQSVSGAGFSGVQELISQTQALMANAACPQPEVFPYTIAFNCIPQIGEFQDDGHSREEDKMVQETRKILGLPELAVIPTCVRVPVLYSHSESIYIETVEPIDVATARRIWDQSPGIELIDQPAKNQYPMPTPAYRQDSVFVGRIRAIADDRRALAFWCVSDNLRKGAALNAVQIAETLIARRR